LKSVSIIGGGLAGSEAAWQIAQRGFRVTLYEMRPQTCSSVHRTDYLGELVCSNSLRGAELDTAPGLLKEELRRCSSLIMHCADLHRVGAGNALAVDREMFAAEITLSLENHPNIKIVRAEMDSIPDEGLCIIATGPLTSKKMEKKIKELTGSEYLYFYDAAAPIVEADSIDYDKCFWASRYDKGEADYLNCPMNKEEYDSFYKSLIEAEVVPVEEFEKEIFFEGCMPVEVMASRGKQTLLFGPLKPVGLIDPRTGKQAYAVLQLRKDNKEGTLFNLVGFQSRMKWGEQQKVFRLIPALAHAEFSRYGIMHRNTFIFSPDLLEPTGMFKRDKRIFFAGQITGVEGYIESTAGGLVAGINAAQILAGKKPVIFPRETALGSLMRYITEFPGRNFQPMNINFGIIPPWEERIRNKKEKNKLISARALRSLEVFLGKEE